MNSVPTSAGPKLRAGFTDEPLIGMIATWIATRVNGIARSAVPRTRSLFVDWRITATKTAVIIVSTTIAAQGSLACVVVAATVASSYAISTTSEAAIAPRNCAIQ